MADNNIQEQIDNINAKLDFLISEMSEQRKLRVEMEDLKDDLVRVGNDVFQTAVVEFEGISDSVSTGDFWHLTKKLLRNVNHLTKSFEQLESIKDMVLDATPITRELVIDFMYKLDEMDRKGYFAFVKEAQLIIDNIVTSFSPEDVKKLGDNIVLIINTVKNLTQPELLDTVNNALSVYKNINPENARELSTFALLKELRSPEMRKGLSIVIELVKGLANQQYNNN